MYHEHRAAGRLRVCLQERVQLGKHRVHRHAPAIIGRHGYLRFECIDRDTEKHKWVGAIAHDLIGELADEAENSTGTCVGLYFIIFCEAGLISGNSANL